MFLEIKGKIIYYVKKLILKRKLLSKDIPIETLLLCSLKEITFFSTYRNHSAWIPEVHVTHFNGTLLY